ncbi:MAG: DUF2231 domain-containing protein [Phycisphaerales bacterium]
MFQIPSLPPFEGFHPFIVHFTVGILLTAWVPMVLGLIDSKRRVSWFRSALMMVVMGTLFAFAAVFTGEATEEVVSHNSELIEHAIHEHEELAELARNIFIGVSIIFIASFVLYFKVPQPKQRKVGMVGGLLVGLSYALGALALANAGHQGGLLVHQHGLQAPVANTDMSQIAPHRDHNSDNDD